ncbi:Os04g0397400, partial [Oryza sativa Japonica Group]
TEQCEMDEDDPKALLPPQVQTNTKMNSRRYRSSRTDDE